MDQMIPRILQFDHFALDLARGRVRVGEQDIDLPPKPFEVLRHLAENAGRLVPKRELFEVVWPNVTVTDDSLVQCIRELRRKLGDDEHQLIKTISRRGYLLDAQPVAPVAASPSIVRAAGVREAPLALIRSGDTLWLSLLGTLADHHRILGATTALLMALVIAWGVSGDRPSHKTEPLTMMAAPSVAVLPFTQIIGSSSRTEEFNSIASHIATELAGAGRGFTIHVKAVETREGIGLSTRYTVRGSVHIGHGNRQINVQLVEAQTNHLIWGQIFDDVAVESGAQNRIATQIARTVSQQLLMTEGRRPLPAEPGSDDYALLGRAVLVGERDAKANREAQALFETALSLNPDSIPALQGLVRTIVDDVLNGWAPLEQRHALLDRAEIGIQRVLKLAPRSLEGHLLRGGLARARSDNDQAIAAFEHTLNLNRTYPNAHAELGRTLIEIGRAEDAVIHIQDAIRLSPTDQALYIWCYWAGMASVHAGDYEAAVRWLLRSRHANGAYENTLIWLALAYAGLGKAESAKPLVADYLAARPNFTVASWALKPPHRNPIVSVQRMRIASMLVGLGIRQDVTEAHSSGSSRPQ